MHISRDPNNLTPVLNFDSKLSKVEGVKSSELALGNFSDLLIKEADRFIKNFENTNTQSPATLKNESPLLPYKEAERTSSSNPAIVNNEKELTTKEVEEEGIDETSFNDENDEEDSPGLRMQEANFFKNITSFRPLNETKDIPKEGDSKLAQKQNPFHLSLLKITEKNLPYASQSKENTSFIEDAKKLAETYLRRDKKEIKPKENLIPSEKKEILDKTSLLFTEPMKPVISLLNENVSFGNFGKLKLEKKNLEKSGIGSSLPSSIRASGKEIVKKESESSQPEITKHNIALPEKHVQSPKEFNLKKRNIASTISEKEEVKSNSESQILGEKLSRNMGVKDREFSKLEPRTAPSNEKQKAKETNESVTHVASPSNQTREDGGQMGSGEKRGSFAKDGFSFASELKNLSTHDELNQTEKTTAPSKQNIQKNLDELVKQARFDIVQNGKSTAEIIMNPKEFGKLTLRISVNGEKVEGRILVENEEIKILLIEEIGKLKESLKESGLTLESLIVDVWEDSFSFSSNKDDRWDKKDEYNSAHYGTNVSKRPSDENQEEGEVIVGRSKGIEIFA